MKNKSDNEKPRNKTPQKARVQHVSIAKTNTPPTTSPPFPSDGMQMPWLHKARNPGALASLPANEGRQHAHGTA